MKNLILKKCFICKENKLLSDFCHNKNKKSGYNGICKKCTNLYYIDDRSKKPKPKGGYKFCSKCKEEKLLSEFHKGGNRKDKIQCVCKKCESIRNIQRTKNKNKDKYIIPIGYKICNNCKIEKQLSEFHNNKQAKDKHYSTCKICKVIEVVKISTIRLRIDPLFKLRCTIYSIVHRSFKGLDIKKNSKTLFILGCSCKEFKIHIESQFEDWMNWNNYGLYNGELNYGWDLDHIMPLSSAKNEEELIKLNHYTNFQPLCSYVNRYEKRDKII